MTVLETIASNCGPHIERLKLEGIQIDMKSCNRKQRENICGLISQMTELHFDRVQLFHSSQLFDACSTVEIINFKNVVMDSSTEKGFLRKYPHIRALYWTITDELIESVSSDSFAELLASSPFIQRLKIWGPDMSQTLISTISDLPELVDLGLHMGEIEVDLNSLAFAHLKRLQLYGWRIDEALMQNIALIHSLTTLDLINGSIYTGFMNDLLEFKNLEFLKIINVTFTSTPISIEGMLLDLINNLPNLRCLHFKSHTAALDMYQLKNLCNSRTNNSRLLFFWNCFLGDVVYAVSYQNTTLVYPVAGKAVASFGYDDFSEDFLTILARLEDVIRTRKIVSLIDGTQQFAESLDSSINNSI